MGIIELIIVAVGLSMDAFAAAVGKGLSMGRTTVRDMLTVGLYFGISQAVMPLLGFFLGTHFAGLVGAYDHWIAFGLLGFIGVKMVIESLRGKDSESGDNALTIAKMLPLAIATSIDALAAGISFAVLSIDIVPAVCLIGLVTMLLSMAGVKVGSVFGEKYKSRAELCGGIALIFIGFKILLDHTGLI